MSPSTQRQSWLWVWFVVIFILGIWFWKVYSDSKALRPPFTPVPETPTTPTTLTISPQDPNIGNPQASLVLVELADFECPYCAEAAPILEQFAQDNPNSVRLVWKDFIIPNHSNSLPAAIAAQCAARQGKFWEYQHQLFSNQATLGADFYLTLADSLGLNTNTFNNCVSNQDPLPLIQFNQQQISALGLNETPTLFVDGQIYTGDITAEALNSLLP